MMKKIAKIVMSSAIAASTLTIIPGSPIAPQPALAQSCSTIHMVNVDGTGSSNINNNPTDGGIFSPTLESIKYAQGTTQDVPNLSIDYWNLPYDSAAGAAHSIVSPVQSPVPYGLSRIKGAQIGLEHIKEYHESCPTSKIGLTGYSQGASVAGDITALLANGAVEGFTKDDFFGTILLADPGRSGKSESYNGPQNATTAYIPIPRNATYERNGEYSTITTPDTIGWTGQRSLGFKDFSGRVISICNDDDVACSVQPNSILRSIADLSDKNYAPGENYRQEVSLAATIMSQPLTFFNIFGGIDNIANILQSEDVRSQIPEMKTKVAQADSLNDKEKAVVNNTLDELNAVLTILHQENAYGQDVADSSIFAHIINSGSLTVGNMVPEEFKPFVSSLTSAITANAPQLPDDVQQRMDPVIKQVVANYHGSYFQTDEGMYTVDGVRAIDWVSEALATGARNLANNTPIEIQADPQNNGDIEIAEPNRQDDGLRAVLDGTIDSMLTTMGNEETDNTIQDAPTTSTPDDTQEVINDEDNITTTVTEDVEEVEEDTITVDDAVPANEDTAYGPQVDTGGHVKESFISHIIHSIIK